MSEINETEVLEEVRAWLEVNWDPNLSLVEWRNKLADSGWGMPAWPKEWDVDFKIHAPQNTIVSGKLAGGELKDLKVIPESRKEDLELYLKN